MENRLKTFLSLDYGCGFGDGNGNGCGWGDGDGCGFGDGDGWGWGDGNGYGFGNGTSSGNGSSTGTGYGGGDSCGFGNVSGCGWGTEYGNNYTNNKDIKEINGYSVNMIDNTTTIITHIKNNIAKGYILNNDLTLTPCYVIKQNNLFAHGKTLHEAQEALHDKLFEELDTEERIELFREHFDSNKAYPAADFFDWHNKLTGSCLMGREAFVKNNNIDMSKDYTVKEFIKLCENDYGGNVIQQLKEWYK